MYGWKYELSADDNYFGSYRIGGIAWRDKKQINFDAKHWDTDPFIKTSQRTKSHHENQKHYMDITGLNPTPLCVRTFNLKIMYQYAFLQIWCQIHSPYLVY